MNAIAGKDLATKSKGVCDPGKAVSCSINPGTEQINYAEHWDKAFNSNKEEQLGWFETDLSPSLRLLESAGLSKDAKILIAGAGNSRLIDEILGLGYSNIIATDISQVALDQLKNRLGEKVTYVVDDLTNPSRLKSIEPVNYFFDRAVLHFFTKSEDRTAYKRLLDTLVKPGAYIALAEFAEDGAIRCSGLDVLRYSIEDMSWFLGEEYKLIESFRFLYTMPSGDTRPYNYGLFKRFL